MLSFVENLVAQHDFVLYRHLLRHRITALVSVAVALFRVQHWIANRNRAHPLCAVLRVAAAGVVAELAASARRMARALRQPGRATSRLPALCRRRLRPRVSRHAAATHRPIRRSGEREHLMKT